MTDGSSGKVPVARVAADAWRFLQAHWREFLPGAALLGAATAFSNSIVPSAQTMGLAVIALAISTVAGAMLSSAVYRRILRDERTGLFGLTLGADEVRLIGVAVLLALMFVPLFVLVFFVVGVVIAGRVGAAFPDASQFAADPEALGQAVAAALGPQGMLAFTAFLLLVMAIAIYVGVRLSLVSPATIGERRIVILQTWSWSRGNVLPMLGAICLTVIPGLLISMVIGGFLARMMAPLAGQLGFVIDMAMGFIGAVASIPGLALGAALYKGLRPTDFVAK